MINKQLLNITLSILEQFRSNTFSFRKENRLLPRCRAFRLKKRREEEKEQRVRDERVTFENDSVVNMVIPKYQRYPVGRGR